jgi:hypothetical protein
MSSPYVFLVLPFRFPYNPSGRKENSMLATDTWLTDEDRHCITKATCFAELLAVALQCIPRNRNGRPIIQVCGPMSTGGGTFEENTAHIARIIEALRKEDFAVFSQVSFQLGMMNFMTEESYRQDPHVLLEGFYGELFRAGLIHVLAFRRGWEKSFGSRWEHATGKQLGMKIVYLSEDLEPDKEVLRLCCDAVSVE